MSRVVSFLSGCGGLGQTSLIFELGKQLSKTARVCVFDACFGINSLSLKFGEGDSDLKDFLSGDRNFEDCYEFVGDNLALVRTNCLTYDYATKENLIELFISKLKDKFEYVLIDVNSASKNQLSLMLGLSNEAVIISNNDPLVLRSSAKLLQKIYFYSNISVVSLVLNKMRVIAELSGRALGEREIAEILKLEPLFVFPKYFKNNIFSSRKWGNNIFEKFAKSFESLERQEYLYKKNYVGFLGFLRRKLYEKFE